MKTIELKNGTLKNGTDISYREFIEMALDTMPEGGFKYKDFKERDRIAEAMDLKLAVVTDDEGKRSDSFFLEDYDLTILKRLVNGIQWAMRDPFITGFVEYIENLS